MERNEEHWGVAHGDLHDMNMLIDVETNNFTFFDYDLLVQ